jgi:dCMP deaminase
MENLYSEEQFGHMQAALDASTQSTCFKREVGAVIVKDGVVIASGHNGGSRDYMHSRGEGPLAVGYCFYEDLARKEAGRLGIDVKDQKYQTLKKEFRIFCLSMCAERTAIMTATRAALDIVGADMYCTTFPCPPCAKAVRAHGLHALYFINGYDETTLLTQETLRILNEAGIGMHQMAVDTTQGRRLGFYDESPKFYYDKDNQK